jgi:hypothetical protein
MGGRRVSGGNSSEPRVSSFGVSDETTQTQPPPPTTDSPIAESPTEPELVAEMNAIVVSDSDSDSDLSSDESLELVIGEKVKIDSQTVATQAAAESKEGIEVKESEEQDYELESVLQARVIGGRISYFVKWVGFPMTESSWVASEDCNCRVLISDFHRDMIRARKGMEAKGMESAARRRAAIENVEFPGIAIPSRESISIEGCSCSDGVMSYVCRIGGRPATKVASDRVRAEYPVQLAEFLESRLSFG